jgi:excisionase family DNA binding protein
VTSHVSKKQRLCANGAVCVAYASLGQPAKLSRNNRSAFCFRCEERRIDAKLASGTGLRGVNDPAAVDAREVTRGVPGPRCEGNAATSTPCNERASTRWFSQYLCKDCATRARRLGRMHIPPEVPVKLTPRELTEAPGWWYTMREVANALGVDTRQVREWLDAGKLRRAPRGEGQRVRVTANSFEAFLRRRGRKSST